MKAIIGLGNPGKEYINTRHNVGFIVLDNYLGNINWKNAHDSLIYKDKINGEDVLFVKPQTFMNHSGLAVKKVLDYYKIDIDNILIIHDDMDIEIGCYKLKCNSSSGGHNGIKNIIENLKTDSFSRLKIGIGKNTNISSVDFVLGKLSEEEINNLNSDTYKEIINSFIKYGIQKTMLLFNKKDLI